MQGAPLFPGGADIPPIEGVSTDTAAFLGETERGPTAPQLVTSYTEFQQFFGGVFGAAKFLPHVVSGFFENGGKRAFICRIAGRASAAPALRDYEAGLTVLEGVACRDVSLVYAPNVPADIAKAIVTHCEKLRYRFAVIDCPAGQHSAALLNPQVAIAISSHAAFYHPWIFAAEPGTGTRTLTPPGGHVLGIYARTDRERGVFKAPANEIVRGALDVEFAVSQSVQSSLTLKNVNVIRTFAGRGIRAWGARTMSSDGEWKYVNVRRFMIYLERSIEEGTKWAVFEPNDEPLWRRVVEQVGNFLRVQWRAGALSGATEREAFFVKCDRSTMTQDDIDNGRLICLIGVAVVRPAEFTIFRVRLSRISNT